jgi:hypothetical protein
MIAIRDRIQSIQPNHYLFDHGIDIFISVVEQLIVNITLLFPFVNLGCFIEWLNPKISNILIIDCDVSINHCQYKNNLSFEKISSELFMLNLQII